MTNRPRRLTHSALALLLLAPSARAQRSGVLLGLRDGSAGYHTLWIAPDGDSMRVAARGPDLIVPTRSGFARVCVVGRHAAADDGMMESDSIVVRPATADRGPCATVDSVTAGERSATSCSATRSSDILFAGGDAISVEEHHESDCGAHYTGGTNLALRTLDGRPLDLRKYLSPTRRRALARSALAAGRRAFYDFGTFDDRDRDRDATVRDVADDPRARMGLDDEWAIERGEGVWQVATTAGCAPYAACGDDTHRFSVAGFAAPAALVGHDRLAPSLEAIRARLPRARDAFASPGGDVVVVVTQDELLVFTPRGADLGAPVLERPIDGSIVEAQWATGRSVGEWTARLTGILGRVSHE